jgi:hypothetical protein
VAVFFEPIRSFEHLAQALEGGLDPYPYYCMLMYAPGNGLDERLANYTHSRWDELDRLTGDSCLLFAMDSVEAGRPLTSFRPQDIFEIARYLGATVADVPGMLMFTQPHDREDVLVLRLREILPPSEQLKDEDLSILFREWAAIMDSYAQGKATDRLDCLESSLEDLWPTATPWPDQLAEGGRWLVKVSAGAGSVATSIGGILTVVQRLFG